MRSDLIIDGFVFGRATVGGVDSTQALVRMQSSLRRKDVGLLMLQGCVISLYNIVDLDSLARKSHTAVVCLTFEATKGIEEAIRHHFPGEDGQRLALYRKLGPRIPFTLRTGHRVYYRAIGLAAEGAQKVLDLFALQGAYPEPVRVAKLLARAKRAEMAATRLLSR